MTSAVTRACKRAIDVAGSAIALAVLSPLLLTVAVFVSRSSPGPVIYRSRRLGRGAVPFDMLKFRTMYEDSADLRNSDGSTYNAANDPRVTPFGTWLRRTSLDELPQLWNVIRGDMSLVGPRPDLEDHLRYYAPEDMERLTVRPGITGLAQVTGRNVLPWARRREIDVEYVRSLSLGRDVLILLRTVPMVLSARGVFSAREQ